MINFHILTLFPDMITQACDHSILKRAIANGHISINAIDIRDYSPSKHGQVDDYPYGGGAGMVMMVEPIYNAYMDLKPKINTERVIYMSPQGKTFDQEKAKELSKETDIVLLCGHYEGIDERAIEMVVTEEISIGNYVLSGGELPALVLIDSVSRLCDNVLNNHESIESETFHNDLLEYPQYTRPQTFKNLSVPEILLSGHHKKIEDWRLEQSVIRTKKKRPDLLD